MNDRINHGVLFDHGRTARIGLPEAVFSEGKNPEALAHLLTEFAASDKPILFTRLAAEIFYAQDPDIQKCYHYHELSGTAFTFPQPKQNKGQVAIVSAGTADGRSTWEAAKTLEYLGIDFEVFEDNGVAGLWRLTSNLEKINASDVIIVVAGLDAALSSVLGGLTSKPIFGVPTSTGYGVARGGESALSSMLTSCAPGLAVFNIDNGYGAACAAARVINQMGK